MRFGPRPTRECEGAILAHGYRVPAGAFRKGDRLDAAAVRTLVEAGVREVVVAEPAPGDILEDEAARRIARAAAGANLRLRDPFTGRCNLVAVADGVVRIDAGRVESANAVDEALTLATLPPGVPVRAGDLVATAKVIPLAVDGGLLEKVEAALSGEEGAVALSPFRAHRAGLVLTTLPGTREGVLGKSEEVLRRRLAALGSEIGSVRAAPHREDEVARALDSLLSEGLDPVLVLGASAVVDREDVVPRAVTSLGGTVRRLGIPVDPGNLLLLGRVGSATVVGVPGCARSPRRSGFDLVLERLLAGLPVDGGTLSRLGVGGLLAEIPSRPQPRDPHRGGWRGERPGIAGILLAAGSSRRMGAGNKLLETLDGVPLVARVADVLLASPLDPVVVVTGHDAPAVRAALAGRPVRMVHAADHASGMSASLRAGVAGVGEGIDGVVVALGDMPRVTADDIEALIEAFDPAEGTICVPVHDRKRGNPVLLPASLLPEVANISGDVGAREILVRHADRVREVPVDHPGVLLDVDTREALEELRDPDGVPP